MRIKAIFFDLFETLISEFENGSRKAPRSTLLEEQLQVDTIRYRAEWNSRQGKRMDGTYSDFPTVMREILHVLEHPINEEIIEILHTERIAAKAIPFGNMDKSILLMLEELKKLGLKICLISNCTPEEVTAWHSSELAEYFDDALFSYEVKLAKPNPLIYQLACDRIGVSPEESLFVGDGGSNELHGAAKVGIDAYHATWFIPPYISERITDYPKLTKPAELIDLARKLAL